MKERPILFNGKMVRAILDGRKTQTRRMIMRDEYKCPYGKIGDRLWVKETFYKLPMSDEVCYKADEEIEYKAIPSIHMPRSASRITLEITNIRVERLQDISADDCRAEGVGVLYSANKEIVDEWTRSKFLNLWVSIHGPESWDENPFVWVVEFKKI